jgi:hypothetical protein
VSPSIQASLAKAEKRPCKKNYKPIRTQLQPVARFKLETTGFDKGLLRRVCAFDQRRLTVPKTIWQRQTFALLAEEAVVADAWVVE